MSTLSHVANVIAQQAGDYSADEAKSIAGAGSAGFAYGLGAIGPGIGIGAGQVNSALCTPSTIVAGADYNRYVFADKVYLTPNAQRLFGDYAQQTLSHRW